MFKVAVVGVGGIGGHHCKCYQSTQKIQLAAVVDIVPEKAQKVGEQYGVPWFTELKAVLKRKDIDFIDVCVPTGLHGDIIIAAVRAGKHVISEKPQDVTPQRCDQIIKAVRKSGRTYGGIFQHRFADDTRRAKAAIDAGRLGRITFALCNTPWWRAQEYYDSGDWRGTWKLDGGGCLMNQAVHAIDLLVYLCGPIKAITAKTARLDHERIEVEDVAVATVEFESGALGAILGSTSSFPGSAVHHELCGTKGMIYLDDDKATLWKLADELEAEKAGKPAAAPADTGASSDPMHLVSDIFARNLDDVARAAREGRDPIVSVEQHRKAVEVICAIYKSAQTGKTVLLPLKRFKPKV
jgi:predicted dehydrogenase